jgi:O-antigen ligase
MRPRGRADGARPLRVLVLVLLGAGPLLAGAVHEPVFGPLLVGCAAAGIAAHRRARPGEGRERSPLPGRRLLLALHALVLVQLVPLPPAVLRVASPGSFSFYNDPLLVPLTAWKPISVSPPDTLSGLAFLAAFSLLYLAVFREMAEGAWRRRLLLTVVGAGVAITVVAFLQAVSPEPRKIYGLWRPRWDWAVFGPYVNRNHFAGYLVMAAPLAVGFALEAISRLRAAWERRRRGWLLLGEREGNAVVRWSAVVMVIVAGLLASQSRGGVSAFALAALLLPLASRRRRRTAIAVALLVGLGVLWIGLGGVLSAFEVRGIQRSRLDLWRDMLPMVPRFPVFGVGWNAFATAYPWYQTIWKTEWIGEAHNDYLQVLLDGGIVGLALVTSLLAVFFRGALARAARSPLDLGILGALLGFAIHGLVDFNGQIPANAATAIALAALAVSPLREPRAPGALDAERERP